MKLLFLSLVLCLSAAGYAEEKSKSAEATDEADQLITNRRLRASEGSLSKWSVSTFWNYQGGSVNDPTDPERPNIVNGGNVQTLQSLSGEVGVKYRLTPRDSITASTGLFMTTPFHSKIDKNSRLKQAFDDNSRKLNVQDPFLKYAHLDSIFGIQSISTVQGKLITSNQLANNRFRSELMLSQNFMKDVGKTGFSYGAALIGYFYDFRDSVKNDALTDKLIGLYPQAEYVINDTYNLRTVFGWQVYENLRGNPSDTYSKRKVYQSVGLGISVTRDLFLYPNIQFIPSNMRDDVTNIAMSANINLF
ncbi:MAG: hypothetical protein ACOVP4_04725 [Bacteriovoracaceae bacterium]